MDAQNLYEKCLVTATLKFTMPKFFGKGWQIILDSYLVLVTPRGRSTISIELDK